MTFPRFVLIWTLSFVSTQYLEELEIPEPIYCGWLYFRGYQLSWIEQK